MFVLVVLTDVTQSHLARPSSQRNCRSFAALVTALATGLGRHRLFAPDSPPSTIGVRMPRRGFLIAASAYVLRALAPTRVTLAGIVSGCPRTPLPLIAALPDVHF